MGSTLPAKGSYVYMLFSELYLIKLCCKGQFGARGYGASTSGEG